jgi:nicotinate-nucleotide adenylyltransferase
MTVGLFGGTFNPVHWGHLRTALEIKKALRLTRMLLVPCGSPPHREQPDVNSETRLAMLKAAVTGYSELEIDDRELKRTGPSYTVDTLQSLHNEMPEQSFVLCVGVDAFLQFNTWHRWQDIFNLAHIVIAHRPGWSMESIADKAPKALQTEIEQRYISNPEQLNQNNSGLILELKVTQIDISSSDIRQRIINNEPISELVPEAVVEIIQQHNLYKEVKGN